MLYICYFIFLDVVSLTHYTVNKFVLNTNKIQGLGSVQETKGYPNGHDPILMVEGDSKLKITSNNHRIKTCDHFMEQTTNSYMYLT